MPRRKADTQEKEEQQAGKEERQACKEEQQAGIEENFVQLEEIIKKLEAGDSTLEESFACYEAGMKLVKSLNSQIDKVEKKIQILSEGDEHE